MSDGLRPHPHFHSLCKIEFDDFTATEILLEILPSFHFLDGAYWCGYLFVQHFVLKITFVYFFKSWYFKVLFSLDFLFHFSRF